MMEMPALRAALAAFVAQLAHVGEPSVISTISFVAPALDIPLSVSVCPDGTATAVVDESALAASLMQR